MSWERVADYEDSKLKIIFPIKKSISRLSGNDYQQILDNVRQRNITSLKLSQLQFANKSRSDGISFENFFRELLLNTPQLNNLNLGGNSLLGVTLSKAQLETILDLVSQSHYMSEFIFCCNHDDFDTANLIATMVAKNNSLKTFYTTISDDQYQFPVLTAAVKKDNLDYLYLPNSLKPLRNLRDLTGMAQAQNKSLKIIFEDRRIVSSLYYFAIQSPFWAGKIAPEDGVNFTKSLRTFTAHTGSEEETRSETSESTHYREVICGHKRPRDNSSDEEGHRSKRLR